MLWSTYKAESLESTLHIQLWVETDRWTTEHKEESHKTVIQNEVFNRLGKLLKFDEYGVLQKNYTNLTLLACGRNTYR